MSVTPGSDTLWSVHSGQRCCTMRFASSTRPWKVRSSSCGAGRDIWLLLGGDRVEGEHEVARVVAALDRVGDADVHERGVLLVVLDGHVLDLDAGLPPGEGAPHLVGGEPRRRRVRRGEDQVVDAA